jgi:hypothetical protein
MLPYLEIQREHLILLLGYGTAALFVLALALGGRRFVLGRPRDPKDEHYEQFRDNIKEGHGKVPMFLIVLYLVLGVWAVVYITAHAFWGMEFDG